MKRRSFLVDPTHVVFRYPNHGERAHRAPAQGVTSAAVKSRAELDRMTSEYRTRAITNRFLPRRR